MSKKNKKAVTPQAPLTEKQYWQQRVPKLPFGKCYLQENYLEVGITNLLVIRNEPSGKFSVGIFCVDVFCLGVKNAHWRVHLEDYELEKIVEMSFFQAEPKEVDLHFAHNLIYGSIDYAEEIGFSPHKDFAFCEKILDTDLIDDGIDEIEFGKDGKPFYISGPYDNPAKILATLERKVGAGNFDFLSHLDSEDDYDEEDFFLEDFDEEDPE